MSILTILIVIIVFGVGLYLINRYLPMDATVKTILNLVVIIILIIWILKAIGVFGAVANVRV